MEMFVGIISLIITVLSMLCQYSTELGQIEIQALVSVLMVVTLCNVFLEIVGRGIGTVYIYYCINFYFLECCMRLEITYENSAQIWGLMPASR